MADVLNLFCGVPEKNTTFLPTGINLNDELCFTEGINLLIHAGFVIFSIFGVVATKNKKRTPLFRGNSLLRGWVHFPWHNTRWLLTFVYIFLSFCCLGDGILSQNGSSISAPYLYIVDAVQLLSSILSIMYYNAIEKENDPPFLILFIFHWPAACSINMFKVYQLYMKNFTIYDLTFTLTCILVVVYVLFIILELSIFFQLGYLSPWYSRLIPPLELQDANNKFHQPYVNTFSQVTYSWISWLLKDGSQNPIRMEQLGKISQTEMCRRNFKLFKRSYDKQMETTSSEKLESGDLGKVYLKAFGKPFVIGAALKIMGDLAGLIAPICIDGILRYVADEVKGTKKDLYFVTVSEFIGNGYILTMLMLFSMLLQNICLQLSYYIVIREGMHIRASLQSMIYLKATLLPVWVFSGGLLTVGQIINYLSIDSLQVMMAAFLGFYIVSIPIQIVLAVILLYFQLGISALVGISAILLLAPLQYIISKKFVSIQKGTMECSDERIKKSNEMLHCIKLLKLYSWESIFTWSLTEARKKELTYMLRGSVYVISTLFLTQVTPIIASLLAFSTYSIFTGLPLTSSKAFTALALFDKFNSPLIIFPVIVRMIVNTVVSTNRLASYFRIEELKGMGTTFIKSKKAGEPSPPAKNGYVPVELVQLEDETAPENSNKHHQSADHTDEPQHDLLDNHSNGVKPEEITVDDEENPTNSSDNALEITNGSFGWSSNSDQIYLQDISTKIPKGKITILVGKVGSGKSSLVSAMLGEMATISGSMKWERSNQPVAYSAQVPWLRNASLMDNIVFEEEFDKERFNMVIEACDLQPDIDILPAGEQTEIGEKGIILSGGQKQRVSVARAFYSRCSVVILDDPLSALDVHVGNHIFYQGIMGVLKKERRTVILITHHLRYLKEADHIIVMENGMIEAQGTYLDISAQIPHLVEMWKTPVIKEVVEEKEDEDDNFEKASLQKKEIPDNVDGRLMQDEEKEEGSISIRIYWLYIRSIGFAFFFGLLLAVILKQSFVVVVDFWLADWSTIGTRLALNISHNSSVTQSTERDNYTHYFNGYIALSFVTILTTLVSSIVHVLSGVQASKYLFRKMLVNVMALPLRFYETTPIGRILNRFSSDIKTIDDQIPANLERFLWHLLLCISAILINIIVTPFFLIPTFPLFVLYYFLQKFFRASSRELQRLDSITKSPVFAHFSETLGGLTTIRAYKLQDKFFEQSMDKIDYNNIAYLYLNTINRWLAIRLDFIGTTIVFAAALCALLASKLDYVRVGYVGLAILHAIKMSTFLNWSVREFAELEMQMNAVERVYHYTRMKTEKQLKDTMIEPVSMSWPRAGKIEIHELSARYAEHLDPILHSLTLTIEAGAMVGICGRTGSGKSSLSLSLLRMIDNYEGYIKIDGIDISTVSLEFLRRAITVIPQDPVLFSGSLRYNLDPELLRTDEELWEVLQIAQMDQFVSELPGMLDTFVAESSENLSMGQRQLFCIARAVLRKSKIIILDEATASVDMQTDAALQIVMKTAFKNSTVLIIAHRIQTITDCDRVIVMHQGRIVEDGDPKILQNHDSYFAKLVNASN